jgi:hypothetical protein
VDVVNTMLDASLPLTVIEYDEWGNPEDPEAYACIRSYSPYDNVARKAYPHILVTAGLNDPRVAYWEPAKWTAKLRATKTDHNRLLLRTNMGAGHGGASGRYDVLRENALATSTPRGGHTRPASESRAAPERATAPAAESRVNNPTIKALPASNPPYGTSQAPGSPE